MNRCHDRAPAAAVGRALQLIPAGLLDLVACEFVIGVDPVFADVHRYADTNDGRSYRDTPHCVHAIHQRHRPATDRGTKVVLPSRPWPGWSWDSWAGPAVVVHELGHVLHERVDHGWIAEPTTEYGETDRFEAFADAFADWIWGGAARARVDDRTAALFRALSRN